MKTEKEKMQAGETYYAFDPELMKLHRDCLKWVEEYNRTYFRDLLKEVNYFVNFYRMPILL